MIIHNCSDCNQVEMKLLKKSSYNWWLRCTCGLRPHSRSLIQNDWTPQLLPGHLRCLVSIQRKFWFVLSQKLHLLAKWPTYFCSGQGMRNILKQWCAEGNWDPLAETGCVHLFPTLTLVTSHHELSRDGNIYTRGICKCYKSSFPRPLKIYLHMTSPKAF